jgi:hypothetical protein
VPILRESSNTKAIFKPQDCGNEGFGAGVGGTALAVDAGKLRNDIAKATIAKTCRAFFQPNSNLVSLFTFRDLLIAKEAVFGFFPFLFLVIMFLWII